MTDRAAELLASILELSETERSDFAERLLESLSPGDQADLDEAEINRRCDELDDGKSAAIPWESARRMILQPPDAAPPGD